MHKAGARKYPLEFAPGPNKPSVQKVFNLESETEITHYKMSQR